VGGFSIGPPTEVRDSNQTVYKIKKVGGRGRESAYSIDFNIPTKTLITAAKSGNDYKLRVYRNRQDFIVVFPNHYIKAYIFALLHHKWITSAIAGKQLTDEFNRAKLAPKPLAPDKPLENDFDKNPSDKPDR
jgi:hypothetical protein